MDTIANTHDLPVLHTAIGSYPRTKALLDERVASSLLRLRFAKLPTANRAFAPMVRELRFDVSELAVATFLQARSVGVPIVLLPVVLAARFQEAAFLCRADSPVRGPSDLIGRRVAVRSYSQTTAMWLRGILADGYGIAGTDITWLTFEDAHVASIADPLGVERAAPNAEMMTMLRSGEVDAAIVGNDVPEDPAFRSVFADPAEAAQAFWHHYSLVPINHLLTVRAELVQSRPELAVEVVRMFRAAARCVPPAEPDAFPTARDTIKAGVALALRFTAAQHMLPSPLDPVSVWAGTPDEAWSAA